MALAKDAMRRKMKKNQNLLAEKKKKEREEKLANKVTKSRFHLKHGVLAEKKRILSMAHLTEKQKEQKIKNLNVPNSKKKVTTTTKKLSGAERAKALAKKNIEKYGGTAKAAAANKEAMRLKIRQKYLANKKKKK